MLIVVDTETSGLEPAQGAQIVEIAACAVSGGLIVAEWSTLVWPGRDTLRRPEWRRCREITGISTDDLVDAPDAEEARKLFGQWVAGVAKATGQQGPPLLTSFNRQFDQRFLAAAPWNLGDPARWSGCLMEQATEPLGQAGVLQKHYTGKWKWPKLTVACQHYGIEMQGDAHRALTDARAAAMLAIRMEQKGSPCKPL